MRIADLIHPQSTLAILTVIAFAASDRQLLAQVHDVRSFLIELYVEDGSSSEQVAKNLETAVAARNGVRLRIVDVSAKPSDRERLGKICRYFKQDPSSGPYLYGCNGLARADADPGVIEERLDQLLTMEVFVRSGCPHCAAAKAFLARVLPDYPGLKVVYRDLVTDAAAAGDLQRLADRYRKRAVSVPVIHYLGQLQVGFDQAETTGATIEQSLRKWSFTPSQRTQSRLFKPHYEPWRGVTPRMLTWRHTAAPTPPDSAPAIRAAFTPRSSGTIRTIAWVMQRNDEDPSPSSAVEAPAELPLPMVDPASDQLPLPEPEGLPLPESADDVHQSDSDAGRVQFADASEGVDLPLFGRISDHRLGLPLFTIAVGLVDGFNPCAMWVLLFLLSILVNLKDRRKILAVAGTFVVISGLAYFAFMAAWLSVFELIGFMRPAQVILGLVAVFIGLVHVKDFFAFKQGLTLSIPEAAKPGIYARVRRIVTAEHLTGAIAGAIVLAVLVNVIELLCTAGLPAMYTEILSLRQLPKWKDYAYLGLYNVAYMFDDALMVAIVVITLGKRKLQEHEGRWLKLVSGLVILSLGVVMLFRPEWLV